MSASARKPWIIVGAIAIVAIFVNLLPKPEASTPEKPFSGKQPIQADTPNTTITRPASDNEAKTQTILIQSQAVNREFRDIDPDLKAAFDAAAQIALATPSYSGNGWKNNSEPSLPTLDNREVRATPPVATAPVVPISPRVPDPPNAEIAKTITNLNMREGPGTQYVLVEKLATGVSVAVIGTEAGWAHVRVKISGREGWVNPRYLARD
jgi:uncharacterized protein YgiM (DUF1202 family)